MQGSLFGTDGVRGEVGKEPITPATVLKLGWAAGSVLSREPTGDSVLIGKDTRVSGYMLESALEAGFSSAGVNVFLLGPMPTPGIAHLTRTARACAGVVISASHNPFYDNGIKIFSSEGTKLPDSVVEQIDLKMQEPLQCVPSGDLGKARRFPDAYGRYIEHCKGTFPEDKSLTGLKIVVDCANGAAYNVAPRVFTELGADVICIADEPDGFNINEDCGSTSLGALKEKVVEAGADIGIAMDGDADRVLLVDRHGSTVDGDQILYVMACARYARGGFDGGVAGTLMSNLGLEQAVTRLGISFIRTRVGDRYVHEALKQRGWTIGGEASGHIICLDKTTTGDGIVAALEILEIMLETGKPLDELTKGMELYPQKMINVPIGSFPGSELTQHPQVTAAVHDAEAALGDAGRVVLRPSGTEPVFRVMMEGSDAVLVDRLTREIADVVASVSRSALESEQAGTPVTL